MLIAARIPIFSYYPPCFAARLIFLSDVTCVVISVRPPALRKFVTSSPRNEQGTVSRKVGSDQRDSRSNPERDTRLPALVWQESQQRFRWEYSTWLISGTAGTCVINPMCMKRVAVNSRMKNDRTQAAASFRRKLFLALKFVEYVLRLSGFPFTASAGLGSIRMCLAAFNDLHLSLPPWFDTLPVRRQQVRRL